MDAFDNCNFKSKYEKYKVRVKLWEKEFKKKYNRIPSKFDIREAPKDVRDSYKMYYKLKTALLENTLNEVIFQDDDNEADDDGYNIMEMTTAIDNNALEDSSCTNNKILHLPANISALITNELCIQSDVKNDISQCKIKESDTTKEKLQENGTNRNSMKVFEAVEEFPLNKSAWCNVKSTKGMEKATTKNLIKQPEKSLSIKQKLFQNVSFSKRNPRKSLVRSKGSNENCSSKSSVINGCNSNTNETLLDLQTLLLEKAKEHQQQQQQQISKNSVTLSKYNESEIKMRIDEKWLQRTSQQNGLIVQQEQRQQQQIVNEDMKENTVSANLNVNYNKYGLNNVDLTELRRQQQEQQQQAQTQRTTNKFDSGLLVGKYTQNEKTYESDADSVINDSEEDDDDSSHRHIVKRRRITDKKYDVLINIIPPTNIDKEKSTKKNAVNNSESYDDKKKNRKKVKDDVKPDAKRKSRRKEREKNPITRRKKEKAENMSKDATTLIQNRKKQVTGRRISKRLKSLEHDEADDVMGVVELQDQPPKLEDLKNALTLDNCHMQYLPRLQKFDELNELAEKYVSDTTTTGITRAIETNESSYASLEAKDEKRVAARRKLEAKITAGKLNENFVTINIQKKVFVRGKKAVNYSRYKKKLWKNKKRIAALSGPNMDMAGCDGNALICFTCGQKGHFAKNCTTKGDTLLPLNVDKQLEDNDPSPFPTLEEAEQMAKQTAIKVHNGNVLKIPKAPNGALYRKDQLQVKSENCIKEKVEKEEIETNKITAATAFHNVDVVENHDDDDDIVNFNVEQVIAKELAKNRTSESAEKKYVGHKIPQAFLKMAGLDTNTNSNLFSHFNGHQHQPLYELCSNGEVNEHVTTEVMEALHMFGHTAFRKGQDQAIMRILSGLSTLVTLSTGSGKSLCYQLPAYLYARRKGFITLVISPLVSLMEDQVTGVPHFLRAHCLHTNQTPQQKLKVMELIGKGEVDLLLVSPEGVVAGERSTGFGSILRKLPPIAFACIDEAHCVSQWSHNFRPSYLMICKVLQQNLGVKCILGLTATATLPTRLDIIQHLGITDGERGIISDVPLPDNLILSTSRDENRDNALLELLLSERFAKCHSIIVYCTRRDECERIAGFLRTSLQDYRPQSLDQTQEGQAGHSDDNKRKRKRTHWHAEPYHAGLAASRRRTIQNAFMKNELRIVVATIAFGMGINKPDIRAVIHYNMPKSFESYVQEVGRAGRDNRIAHCHLLLDANGCDQYELRRHIYANSLDRHVIRKLLQRVFVPCSCKQKCIKNINSAEEGKSTRNCGGHEIGFSIDETVEALDIPAENIATLLCYMELDSRWCINVLSNAYIKAKVISYGGAKYLKQAAKQCPPLATAIATQIKNGTFNADNNIVEFSVIDIASAIGWNSGVVKYQLKNLEWIQVNGIPRRSPITVQFYDLGFRLKVPGDFTTEEIDEALDTLYKRSLKQERTQLIQLQYVYQGLSSVAYNTFRQCSYENFPTHRSEQLKAIIRDYFQNDCPRDIQLEIEPSTVSDEELLNDIKGLINIYPNNNFTGRSIARIFHGISSPNYSAIMWHRCKYWRIHWKVNFNRLIQLANNVLVGRRI